MTQNIRCFWCESVIKRENDVTRDHLIPVNMGGKKGDIAISCRDCNEERGRVTELYSSRHQLIENIRKFPNKITTYKNRFRKKVRSMASEIIKWENLHRKKGIILPFSILEYIKLDETMPI